MTEPDPLDLPLLAAEFQQLIEERVEWYEQQVEAPDGLPPSIVLSLMLSAYVRGVEDSQP